MHFWLSPIRLSNRPSSFLACRRTSFPGARCARSGLADDHRTNQYLLRLLSFFHVDVAACDTSIATPTDSSLRGIVPVLRDARQSSNVVLREVRQGRDEDQGIHAVHHLTRRMR